LGIDELTICDKKLWEIGMLKNIRFNHGGDLIKDDA
jgi:hypothetical protein